MKQYYFDQAATSYPKAEGVAEAVKDYIEQIGVNVSRGSYQTAYAAEGLVYDTRVKLCRLFDFDKPQNVIFTQSITYAMNMVLKGYLKAGDHVLVSAMEHNAVMRPLVQLEKERGVSFTRIPYELLQKMKETQELESLLTDRTKAIIMLHASNVNGELFPIRKIGAFAHAHGLKFIVDSAQTAGVYPISMKEDHIDALGFTGHKSLLGPQGIGGFLITDEMAKETEALISGGTGSISDTEETPDFLPDKFEAGTMNLPGIAGLSRSLDWIAETGIKQIYQREMELTDYFVDGLHNLNKEIKEKNELKEVPFELIQGFQMPIVSVQCHYEDEAELAHRLDEKYGIMVRVGMHCAPAAHRTLHTYPKGTLRFSFGYGQTKAELDFALEALRKECRKYG